MKFKPSEAQKKILSNLTKGGKTCYLSERTMSENVEQLISLLVNDETELDAFVEQAMPFFKSINGNLQNDQSQFVTKWNEDHPSPKPDPDPAPPTDDPKESAAVKAIKAELEAIKKEREEEKKEREKYRAEAAQKEKKNELIAKLKEKGVDDKEWTDTFLAEVTIAEDADVDAKVDTYLKLYNKGKAGGKPTPTPGPTGGGGGEDFDSLKEAAKLAKAQRESQGL
jgi:hypothetical protein